VARPSARRRFPGGGGARRAGFLLEERDRQLDGVPLRQDGTAVRGLLHCKERVHRWRGPPPPGACRNCHTRGLRDTREVADLRTTLMGQMPEGAPSGAPEQPRHRGAARAGAGHGLLECPLRPPHRAGCFTFPLTTHSHLEEGVRGTRRLRQHPPAPAQALPRPH